MLFSVFSFAFAAVATASTLATPKQTLRLTNGRHRKIASLLRRGQQRWDFKAAAEELRTEWGIVLRRFYMVDMEFADISLKLATLPPDEGQGQAATDGIQKIARKVDQLAENLQAARRDLAVSQSTIVNMEVDEHLNASAREALGEEHQHQQEEAEILSHLGETALKAAMVLVGQLKLSTDEPASGLKTRSAKPAATKEPAVVMLPAAMTSSTSHTVPVSARAMRNSTAAAWTDGVQHFQSAAQAFRAQRAKLEDGARAASARLLSMRFSLKLARV